MGKSLILLLSLLVLACRPAPRTAGVLPQEVYVWQRLWNAPVRQAIESAPMEVAGFVPLAAEVAWKNGRFTVLTRPALDFATLKSTGKPIGLALRIGAFAGPFSANDNTAGALCQLARSLLEEATRNGLAISELQIDFDCAQSKLGGYRLWLMALQKAVAPVPVCLTVLPSWLKEQEFPALVKTAGRYVLQVHSVERPKAVQPVLLCDPAKAKQWVEMAAKIGVPFRVALPTYTYRVVFDAAGNLTAISAEDPGAILAEGARVQFLRADAVALAALLRAWKNERPAALRGVIWYRLPVSSDSMNWRPKTFAAVLAGRAPKPALRAEIQTGDGNLCDLTLQNDGDLDAALPERLSIEWPAAARLMASDGLDPYSCETLSPGHASFTLNPEMRERRLAAGEQRAIGWLRLDSPQKLHVTFSEN